MTLWGFDIFDLAVMLGFVIALLYIGIRASKHINNQEDFFLGGRRFGKLVTTFTNFGQATSSEHATWMVAGVMKNGAAGITFAIGQGLLFMPVYWFTNRWWHRLRTLTLADFFHERYGSKRMAACFAVTGEKELDERELTLNLEDPERNAAARAFPRSNWEFSRWTAYDVKGLAWILVGVGGCVGLIWLIVNLGK